MEIKKYRGKECIIILKNRLKYEGKISLLLINSFLIQDRILGQLEISNDSVAVIINKEDKKDE
jgi:hypothetical protein